jgi:hypothetical protein
VRRRLTRARAPTRSRFVSEAAKLMGPQPPLAPGERCSLINLPVELLVRPRCLAARRGARRAAQRTRV